MRNCDTEEGGGDEVVTHGDGTLYTQRGFVAVGGCVGDVRGMVRRGVIQEDFLPHSLFGWGVIVEEAGMPIVRSIGYLHLCSPEVRLVPRKQESGRVISSQRQ